MTRTFALVMTLASLASHVAAADTLADVKRKGELVWAMDAQGGAPYVFQSPKDPTRIVGFEVDLADALAKQLGVRARPLQGQWDRLLELLGRGDADVAMNGLEISDDRKRECRFSKAYFVAPLRLTIRRGDAAAPHTREAMATRRIGTLPGSLAEKVLVAAGAVVKGYDGGQGEVYDDLRLGRTDGALMDGPVATYYADLEPTLETLDAPIAEAAYGIALRPDDDALAHALDDALDALTKDGTLETIYSRWGLWNAETAAKLGVPYATSSAPPEELDRWKADVGKLPPFWERVRTRYPALMPIFAKAALFTLGLSLASMLLAVLLGVGLALLRAYGPRPLALLSTLYIEFFRGTPLLVQLTMIYFGLPELGVTLSPVVAGWLALGLNYAAAEAENYRAGLSSVPAGQMEAARALGLTRWQAIRLVIAPQAVRTALPPATNDFIALLKDSSLVSLVTLTELTKTYSSLANATRDHLGLGVMVAVWYLIIGLPFARLAQYAENRLGAHLRRAA